MHTPGRRLSAGLMFAAIAAAASHALEAHHSFAMYDQSITYVLTGVVERINPDVVLPMHCTGEAFISMLRARLPEKVVYSNVGSRFTFGA